MNAAALLPNAHIDLGLFDPLLAGKMYPAYGPEHRLVPPMVSNYMFEMNLTKMLFAWFEQATEPLWLSGPQGSGKDSVVQQFAARLRVPALRITASAASTAQELIGTLGLRDGATVFQDGPVLSAYRHGYLLQISELTLMKQEEVASLNGVFERAPIVVTETGEVVHAHPEFRLVVTDNTGGAGDRTGMFASRSVLDASVADRFWKLVVGYPAFSPSTKSGAEVQWLSRHVESAHPDMPEELRKGLAQSLAHIAFCIRERAQADDEQRLSVTLSLRTLARIAGFVCTHLKTWKARTGTPVLQAGFEIALLGAITGTGATNGFTLAHERQAIRELIAAHCPACLTQY